MYLVQDAKQELFRSNQDLSIIHMIVENYVLDDVKHIFLPLGKKCTKFSIDVNSNKLVLTISESTQETFSLPSGGVSLAYNNEQEIY